MSRFKILLDNNVFIEKECANEKIFCRIESIYISLKDDISILNHFTNLEKLEKFYNENSKLIETTKLHFDKCSFSVKEYISKTKGALKLQFYFRLYKKINACGKIKNAYRHFKFKRLAHQKLKRLAINGLKQKLSEKKSLKVTFNFEEMDNNKSCSEFDSNKKIIDFNTEIKIPYMATEPSTVLDNSTRKVYKNLLTDLNFIDDNEINKNKRKHFTTMDITNKFSNVIDNELTTKIEQLNQEIAVLKIGKNDMCKNYNKLKEDFREKEKHTEILEEKLKMMKGVVGKCEEDLRNQNTKFSSKVNPEVERLKDELAASKKKNNDYEINIEILNLKIEELNKSVAEHNDTIESLKNQLVNRKELFDREIEKLFIINADLEKEKIELEKKSNTNDNLTTYLETLTSNADRDNTSNQKLIQLKKENRSLSKQLEELRLNYSNEIGKIRSDLVIKDTTINDLISSFRNKEDIITIQQNQIQDNLKQGNKDRENIKLLQLRIFQLENNELQLENAIRAEMEKTIKAKDEEILDLKEIIENNSQLVDRNKKLELALRNELKSKDIELSKRTEIITKIQFEIDKFNDENMILRKENTNLRSKVELLQNDANLKMELNNKIKEIFILKENTFRNERYIEELEVKLEKINKKMENKSKLNNLLFDIVNVKKSEVQCLEALKYTDSVTLRENLNTIRITEAGILAT
jgi:chromosome segregation ATPase